MILSWITNMVWYGSIILHNSMNDAWIIYELWSPMSTGRQEWKHWEIILDNINHWKSILISIPFCQKKDRFMVWLFHYLSNLNESTIVSSFSDLTCSTQWLLHFHTWHLALNGIIIFPTWYVAPNGFIISRPDRDHPMDSSFPHLTDSTQWLHHFQTSQGSPNGFIIFRPHRDHTMVSSFVRPDRLLVNECKIYLWLLMYDNGHCYHNGSFCIHHFEL